MLQNTAISAISAESQILCSVGILTFNSAETLGRALESVRDFDDIVICDGGSTDGTLEIAHEFGARVIEQDTRYKKPDGTLRDYSGVRNQCLEAARHEWFLYIDSDETISDGLREDIRRIAQEPLEAKSPLVYRIPIGILMDGCYIKHSTNYPGYQTRFFNKRSGARFVRPVHERIVYDANVPTAALAHPWYVHTTREYWLHYVRETDAYRPLEVARACASPLGPFLYYGVIWHLRISLATVLKALFLYAVHGTRDALPIRGELGRAAAPLVLIGRAIRCRLRRLALR